MSEQQAQGWGLATVVTDGAGSGTVLDTWFPAPSLGQDVRLEAPGLVGAGLVVEDSAVHVQVFHEE